MFFQNWLDGIISPPSILPVISVSEKSMPPAMMTGRKYEMPVLKYLKS